MKKLSLLTVILVLTLLSIACSTTYIDQPLQTPAVSTLQPQQKGFVALAADGGYGGKIIPGTGMKTTQALAMGLSPYLAASSVADTVMTKYEVLARAKRENAKYAFVPTLINWEQRASGWSGRPSKASVTIAVYDVPQGKQIMLQSVEVEGASSHTQDIGGLLKEAVRRFCEKSFTGQVSPQ